MDRNSDNYANYGGRGITVCERWNDFKAFFEDMGPRPPGTSLDRTNNDGPYEPGNCRWATPAEQLRNTRCNKTVFVDGKIRRTIEIEEELGLKRGTISARLKNGWSAERACKTPLTGGGRTYFSSDEICRIRAAASDGLSRAQIATQFHRSKTAIGRLLRGETYSALSTQHGSKS
jgi:hypothetical protein